MNENDPKRPNNSQKYPRKDLNWAKMCQNDPKEAKMTQQKT